VDFGGPLRAQVVDDTSVHITVVEALGIDPNHNSEFQVFQNVPNPFSEVTRLTYYTPNQGKVELSIYNILGVLVHQETELAAPGKHHFNFNGSELQPGTYLYQVEAGEDYFSGKLRGCPISPGRPRYSTLRALLRMHVIRTISVIFQPNLRSSNE